MNKLINQNKKEKKTYKQNQYIRHNVTNKSRATKTYTKTTTTSYLETRLCEPSGTFKAVGSQHGCSCFIR